MAAIMHSAQPFRLSPQRRAVITPYDARIAQLIPHAQTAEKNGKLYHITPHKDVETKLLNNFGYTVPAPILSQYDWAGTETPFESQKDTARLLTQHDRAYVLNDMGTGKTRAALFACDYLMSQGVIDKVLIIAPLSTLNTVWEREIFECFPHRSAVSLYGTKKKRLTALHEDHDFYIINHDGVVVISDELLARTDIDTVILDELALLRNHRTTRWKVTKKVIDERKRVWGMTGSPTPKAPTDAYGQIKLLTPSKLKMYFNAFRAQTMYQVSQFRWNARKDANETVHSLMQPSVRYVRSDCVDLPPTTYTTLDCALSKGQAAGYKEMYEECAVQVAEALLAGTNRITAANAGVQFSKLVQIASGFVYGKIGNTVNITAEFDDSPRLKLLQEVIDETEKKIIVFAPFVHLVNHLEAVLLKKGYSVSKIHGGTPKAIRDEIFTSFQHSATPRVLVAHPQTMSHGLTLTAANTILWYAPVFSLETYEQANARITRPSQTSNTHIIHIQATPVEKRIYKTLQHRGSMQKALLGLFRGE